MNNYLKYIFIVLMFLSNAAKAQDKTKGFEYAFKIHLNIGIDWRPVFGVVYNDGFNYNSVGLNI